ncbi:MAG TPA: hypothetical protein VG253_09945 [Streptosporangiaceae bacterium]|nr:hypothetical protein [Streptosporangiaceae bacterium]
MKTASGLALIAVGAILAFAVQSSPSWFSFQAAGWVLIVVGLAGMFVPRRGYGWLRRRVVVRRPRGVGARTRRSGLHTTPGTVLVTPEDDGTDVGAKPSQGPLEGQGRQLSKAEAEQLRESTENGDASEVIEEYLEE